MDESEKRELGAKELEKLFYCFIHYPDTIKSFMESICSLMPISKTEYMEDTNMHLMHTSIDNTASCICVASTENKYWNIIMTVISKDADVNYKITDIVLTLAVKFRLEPIEKDFFTQNGRFEIKPIFLKKEEVNMN